MRLSLPTTKCTIYYKESSHASPGGAREVLWATGAVCWPQGLQLCVDLLSGRCTGTLGLLCPFFPDKNESDRQILWYFRNEIKCFCLHVRTNCLHTGTFKLNIKFNASAQDSQGKRTTGLSVVKCLGFSSLWEL